MGRNNSKSRAYFLQFNISHNRRAISPFSTDFSRFENYLENKTRFYNYKACFILFIFLFLL